MATVIGVRFRNAGKLYYFDPCSLWPTAGDAVIVETARGLEYGDVVTGVQEVADESITPPLRKLVRIATPEDVAKQKDNAQREQDALAICQKKIDDHQLQMKLVGCEYTFDNSKILFYFTSDKRVDFRALVKDLASVFRTRIELRQIGVRDEAKMMGGLGLCGRPVCCAQFLGDFQPVSIKMAKEQSLSLNPTKISGVCGRLMCCLKYEEDYYEKTRKQMPRIGREVLTPDGPGMVVDLNILKETVRVRIPKGDSTEQKDYPMTDIQRATPAKAARPTGEAAPQQTAESEEDIDPEVMKALKVSEMDVPSDEPDDVIAEETASDEADETDDAASDGDTPDENESVQTDAVVPAPQNDVPATDGEDSEGKPESAETPDADGACPEEAGDKTVVPAAGPAPDCAASDKTVAGAPAPINGGRQQKTSFPKLDPWTVPDEFKPKL